MLAKGYGLSRKELKGLVEQYAETRRREGDCKPLEPCYDISRVPIWTLSSGWILS